MPTLSFRLHRLLTIAAICSLIAWLGPEPARADVDDFNDGNDDGWTHYNPLNTGSWSFPNGSAYRLQSAVSPSPSTLGPARVGSFRTVETYSAFYVAVDIVGWDNSLDQIFGLITRVTTPGLGTTKGYTFTYATHTGRGAPQLEILSIAGERGTDIASPSNFTFQVGSVYRLVFTGALNQLRGEVYLLPDLITPVVVMTANNSLYTSGQVGVFTYDNSSGGNHTVDTTFDNFEFKELPPPLTIARDPTSTDVRLSWPTWATGYGLERTENLPAVEGDWELLGKDTDFPQDGGYFFTFEDTTIRNHPFYRLRK
jgi:hypothetical protein